MKANIINFVFLILFLIYLYFVYKKGKKYKTDITKAFETLDYYLLKRYNLVGELLENIKSSFQHEEMLIIKIKELIKYDYEILTRHEKLVLNGRITTGHEKLFAAVERLELGDDFLKIKKEINDLNDTIEKTKKSFNASVNTYNAYLQNPPHCIFTTLFKFNSEEVFENVSNKIKNSEN